MAPVRSSRSPRSNDARVAPDALVRGCAQRNGGCCGCCKILGGIAAGRRHTRSSAPRGGPFDFAQGRLRPPLPALFRYRQHYYSVYFFCFRRRELQYDSIGILRDVYFRTIDQQLRG
jgi:hypothetical protein